MDGQDFPALANVTEALPGSGPAARGETDTGSPSNGELVTLRVRKKEDALSETRERNDRERHPPFRLWDSINSEKKVEGRNVNQVTTSYFVSRCNWRCEAMVLKKEKGKGPLKPLLYPEAGKHPVSQTRASIRVTGSRRLGPTPSTSPPYVWGGA